MPTTPSLAVVVPARDAEAVVGRCLDALLAAGFAGREVVVVDDGSQDGTGAAARARGARALRNEAPDGPARARNRGAAATAGEVVVFVDADVAVHPDSRARIEAFFRDHPRHVALMGSYDARPAAPRAVSRYRNLLHHWVHQQSPPEVGTFWAGLGAVRRTAFEAAGGFDPAWPIEDVELGLRLREAGGLIRLDRGLQGTHLKDWTLRSMVRTDWKVRAVPWARLLRAGRAPKAELNLGRAHRASGALVALLPLLVLGGVAWPPALGLALACAGGFVLLNARFFAFLARTGGWSFAARAVPLHALHYAAAVAGYAEVLLRDRRRPPGPWRREST